MGVQFSSIDTRNREANFEQFKLKEQIFTVDFEEDTILIKNINGEISGKYHIMGQNRNVISSCIDDLDKNGYKNILLVVGEKGVEFGDALIILSFDGTYIKEIYHESFKILNPWKVQTCDVDGDGQKEISLGVYKETQFHPVMDKRPFIYEWQESGIFPKWRGSRLSRPFSDYIFSDMDDSGTDELIAIEVLESGEKILHAYKWKGFGFEGVGESLPYRDIETIKIIEEGDTEKLYALIKKRGKAKWVPFYLVEDKIEILMEEEK